MDRNLCRCARVGIVMGVGGGRLLRSIYLERKVRKTAVDRKFFLDRVAMVPESGCWIWLHQTNQAGYGVLSYRDRIVRAHRLCWEQFQGPISDGAHVLHKCDTRPCINPDHLFLGSNDDNVRDMISKKRNRFGETHPARKLTADDVKQIRASTERNMHLANRFGVSRQRISDIRHGRGWEHVA